MEEITFSTFRIEEDEIITSNITMRFDNPNIIELWMLEELERGNVRLFLGEFNNDEMLMNMLKKRVHDGDLNSVLDILGNNTFRWRLFSKMFIGEISFLSGAGVFNLSKNDRLRIINNRNFVVDVEFLRPSRKSKVLYNRLPQEILLKTDYKALPVLLEGELGSVNYRLLRYKLYKFLYKMFPTNTEYWKVFEHYRRKLITKPNKFTSYPKEHDEYMIVSTCENILTKENIPIEKSPRELLYYILAFLLTEVEGEIITPGDLSSLGDYYFINKDMIDDISLRWYNFYPFKNKALRKIKKYLGKT